jgi:hypothetical protein
VQFRAEMFNVSNTPHFAAPDASETSANFMVISDVRNIGREGRSERLYRFGLRLARGALRTAGRGKPGVGAHRPRLSLTFAVRGFCTA